MIWISIPKMFLLAALPRTFMSMKKQFRKRKRKSKFHRHRMGSTCWMHVMC
ncbi:unnamed protein product [Musa banksii]